MTLLSDKGYMQSTLDCIYKENLALSVFNQMLSQYIITTKQTNKDTKATKCPLKLIIVTK